MCLADCYVYSHAIKTERFSIIIIFFSIGDKISKPITCTHDPRLSKVWLAVNFVYRLLLGQTDKKPAVLKTNLI